MTRLVMIIFYFCIPDTDTHNNNNNKTLGKNNFQKKPKEENNKLFEKELKRLCGKSFIKNLIAVLTFFLGVLFRLAMFLSFGAILFFLGCFGRAVIFWCIN